MAEKAREKVEKGVKSGHADGQAAISFLTEKEAVDPSLAILFASSVSYLALLAVRTHSAGYHRAKIYKGRTC
jgi:hypothetical protein